MKRKIRIKKLPKAQQGQQIIGKQLTAYNPMEEYEKQMQQQANRFAVQPLQFIETPQYDSNFRNNYVAPPVPQIGTGKYNLPNQTAPQPKTGIGTGFDDIRNQEQTLRQGEVATNVAPNIAELQTPEMQQQGMAALADATSGFDMSALSGLQNIPQGAGFVPFIQSGIFAKLGRANEERQRDRGFKNRFLSDNLYESIPEGYSGNRGDYTLNQQIGLGFRPDEAVYGQFGKVAKYGGQMKRKIKITGLPQQAYGGTQDKAAVDEMYPYNSNVRRSQYSNMLEGQDESQVRQYAQEVPREIANIEAERGETIVKPNDEGTVNMYKIGGKRHSEGGTPLQADPNDFIFSDTKDMKIKDPAILESFGMKIQKKGRKGYTPAEISKKFNLNDPDMQRALNDPKADYIEKATAERMYDNNLSQLGKLALVQEGRKGFPQGPPDISMPYMQKVGMDPSMFMPDVMTPQDASFQMGKAQLGQQVPGVLTNPLLPGQEPQINERRGLGYSVSIPDEQTQQLAPGSPASQPTSQSRQQGTTSGGFKDFLTYNRSVLSDFRNRGIDFDLPEVSVDYDVTPGMQRTRESGVFGTQDWGGGDLFNDFKQRNEWYFKENPDFDPSSDKDVYDFQTKYNDKIYKDALNAGYTEQQAREVQKKMGFVETEPGEANPRGTDRKFGQYTWSRSGLDFTKKPKKTPKIDPGPKPGKVTEGPQRAEPGKYYVQDLMNTALAAQDRLGVKKYMPYDAAIPAAALMDPTFYDPSRELAATGEMANIATQNLSQFVGPQAFNARASQIQGNAAKAVADTLGRYNNLNVGVANQFEKLNKTTINDFNLKRALAKSNYYDKTMIANQQYDNAKRAANARLMRQATNAITNKAQTQVLNSLFPEYSIDPTTGGEMMYIPSQRTVTGQSSTPSFGPNNIASARAQYKTMFPSLSNEAIDRELLRQFTGSSRSPRRSRRDEFLDARSRGRRTG